MLRQTGASRTWIVPQEGVDVVRAVSAIQFEGDISVLSILYVLGFVTDCNGRRR